MSKVVVVTDSTSNIPKDLAEKYNIRVIPQVLVWGEDTFRDGIDIQATEFYTRLKTAKVMPTTSQISPADFKAVFEELLSQDYQVLAIVLSSKLSGTLSSAVQAKEQLPGRPIALFDSMTSAMALGFIVLQTARAAAEGASMEECLRLAETTRDHSGVMFAVDTLEFLHRGGRIGGATRLLGTALNIKPILEVCNGQVEVVDRVRTRKKSLQRLLELLEQRAGGRTPLRVATLHANAAEDATEMAAMMNGSFSIEEIIHSEVSPVVGTHTGPGTVGLAYLTGL